MDKQVAPAYSENLTGKMALEVVYIMRTETRESHHGPEPKQFHREVVYVDADRCSANRRGGQQGASHILFRQ